MSSFTAINVKENEGEIDIEEHTRELQIESGYKLFQDALKFQKINDFKTANKLYDELFKMDIIKSNNYSANPNIENLKYLCYRNIGFLKFYELVSDCSERRKKNNQSNGNTTKKKEQNADGADQNKENNERKHEENKQFETNENSETSSQSIKSVENDKAEKSDTKVKIEEGDKFFNNIEGDVTRDIIEINNEIEPSDQEVYDRLLSLVENLITSLNHGDADSELIELLYSIFKYYQLTKLERYSLEYMIMSNSSELSVSSSNNMNFSIVGFENEDYSRILESIKNNTCRFLMPDLSRNLNQYTKLLQKLGILDENNVILKKLKRFGNYLSENKFTRELETLDLDVIKFDELRNLTESKDTFLEFKVENKKDVGIEWDDFIYQLNECLPRYRGKTKIHDNYILTKSPIEGVKIKVNSDEDAVKLNNTDKKEDARKEEPLNTSKYTDKIDKQNLDVTKDSNDNVTNECSVNSLDLDNTTTSQRVSKRLNRTRNETLIPQIDADTFKSQERVFNTINQYLEDLNDPDERNIGNFKITNILPLVFKDLNLDADSVRETYGEKETEILINDPYLYDFWAMLQNWGDDQTEALLASADFGSKSSASSNSSKLLKNRSNSESSNSVNGLGMTSVREILNSTGLNEKAIESRVTLDEMDKGQLNKLIERINKNKMHFTQIRILVVTHLLKYREETGGSLLTDSKISEETQNFIGVFIDACGMYYFKSCKANLMNDAATVDIEILSVSISIYEYLINAYISMIQEKTIKNLKSSAINELTSLENTLLYRIKNWEIILNDIFQMLSTNCESSSFFDVSLNDKTQKLLWYRFNWASFLVLQHQDVDPGFLKSKLQNLTTRIENENDITPDISMINFDNFPRLKLSSLKVQLSKITIFATFTQNEQNSDKSEESNMTLLENMLLIQESNDDFSLKHEHIEECDMNSAQMKNFVQNSSIELRLKLWQLLFVYYTKNDNISKFQIAYYNILKVMKAELNKQDKNSNKFSKGQLLLRIIGSFILFTKAYLDILKKNNWAVDIDHNERHQLTSSNIDSSLKIILYILNFSTAFTIHEDIANEFPNRDSLKSQSSESFLMLKNLSVLVLTVLCYFYYQKLKLKNSNCDVMPESYYENLNDFLSICHEQLGIRRLCGLSDGIFLDFIEAKLVELEWPESDKDIMQCINCRYGIDVAIDSWFPLDHKAPETDLTKLSAVRLSHYILSYCFRKKHPVLKLPTNDIKTLIEYIYEVLGDPDSNNEIISRNYSSIEMFLNTKSLDVRTMKFAFYGLLNVDLEIPALEFRRSIDEGLYYLQALVGFSAFKTKKRNMQSRVADLDSVIALLKSDIACGSNRLESWLLLGQAYSAFVEDDMIWTADKLNNPEKKNITAFMQKQALLCYLKAIDIYAHMSNDQKENLRLVAASLWLTFGNELYNALKEPMSKLAFMVNSVPIYVKKNGQKTYEAVSNNPITAEAIYKILRIAFLMSAKLNSNSWSSLYYLSKIDSKDETDVDSVFEILLKSCSLVPKITSRDDPVLEPHYRLCSLLYKRVMSNSIGIERALEYLKRDSILEVDAENVNNKDDFANIIITSLRKIKRLDRSSWHHKPIYRIAKILDEHFGDVSGAIKEMSEIITIKPTKSLCAIWKPENERPGKHFVYIYDYIQFYVELLDKTNDIEALFSLCRRLRRLGANMVQHLKLWEYSVGISCNRIKETVSIPKGFVDLVLPNLVYSDFIDISKKFLKDIADSKEYSPQEKILFYFLSEISEFRRMANGFGPTSFIDEVYHSLYLKLYLDYEKSHSASKVVEGSNAESSDSASLLKSEEILKPKTPGTPSKEKVRVARRDIMPLCAQLLGIVQKEVEKIKKDIADGKTLDYSLFVSDEQPQELVEVPLEAKEIFEEHSGQSVEGAKAKLVEDIDKQHANVTDKQIIEPVACNDVIMTDNGESKMKVLEKENKLSAVDENIVSNITIPDRKMIDGDEIISSIKDTCDITKNTDSSVTKTKDSSDDSKPINGDSNNIDSFGISGSNTIVNDKLSNENNDSLATVTKVDENALTTHDSKSLMLNSENTKEDLSDSEDRKNTKSLMEGTEIEVIANHENASVEKMSASEKTMETESGTDQVIESKEKQAEEKLNGTVTTNNELKINHQPEKSMPLSEAATIERHHKNDDKDNKLIENKVESKVPVSAVWEIPDDKNSSENSDVEEIYAVFKSKRKIEEKGKPKEHKKRQLQDRVVPDKTTKDKSKELNPKRKQLSRYGPHEKYSTDIIEIIPVSSKGDINETSLKIEQREETSIKETKVENVENLIVIEILDSPENADKKEKDLHQPDESIQRPAKRTRDDDLDIPLKLRKIGNVIDTKVVNKELSKNKDDASATPSKLGTRQLLRNMDVVDSPRDDDDDSEVYVDTVEKLDISPKKLVFEADNSSALKDHKVFADSADSAETSSIEKYQEDVSEAPAAPATRRRSRRGSKGGLMELDHDGKLKKQVDLRAERLRRMSVNSDDGILGEVSGGDKDVKDEDDRNLNENSHDEDTVVGERETRSSLRKNKAGSNGKKRR